MCATWMMLGILSLGPSTIPFEHDGNESLVSGPLQNVQGCENKCSNLVSLGNYVDFCANTLSKNHA